MIDNYKDNVTTAQLTQTSETCEARQKLVLTCTIQALITEQRTGLLCLTALNCT